MSMFGGKQDDLRALLRKWGRVMGVKPVGEWGDWEVHSDSPEHALLRAGRAISVVSNRTRRRRNFLGVEGKRRSEAAPANVCHGVETRSGGSKPISLDPVVEHVDVAVLDLYRWSMVAGVVVRLEYCAGAIGQREKACKAGTITGGRITTRQYRRELEIAHAWLAGRLPTRLVA